MPVSSTLTAYYWIDYTKFGPQYLAKECIDALNRVNALDDCELTVSVEIVHPGGVDQKALDAAVKEFEKKGMATVRAQAGKAFTTIAGCCKDDKPKTEADDDDVDEIEEKKARSALKSLDDYLDKYIFGILGGELRRFVAKELDVRADDFTTLNASKFKLRLNPDIFGFGIEDDKENEKEEALLKDTEKAIKTKKKWLECRVIVGTDKNRLMAAPSGKSINNGNVVKLRKMLKTHKPTYEGMVMVDGTTWEFEFQDDPPGGKGPAKQLLKEMIEEQFELNSVTVEVEPNVQTYTAEKEETKPSSSSSSTTKSDPKKGGTSKENKKPKLASPQNSR